MLATKNIQITPVTTHSDHSAVILNDTEVVPSVDCNATCQAPNPQLACSPPLHSTLANCPLAAQRT